MNIPSLQRNQFLKNKMQTKIFFIQNVNFKLSASKRKEDDYSLEVKQNQC